MFCIRMGGYTAEGAVGNGGLSPSKPLLSGVSKSRDPHKRGYSPKLAPEEIGTPTPLIYYLPQDWQEGGHSLDLSSFNTAAGPGRWSRALPSGNFPESRRKWMAWSCLFSHFCVLPEPRNGTGCAKQGPGFFPRRSRPASGARRKSPKSLGAKSWRARKEAVLALGQKWAGLERVQPQSCAGFRKPRNPI